VLSFDFGEFGARSRKCIAVVLRRPQHERPSRYGGSGRGHSTVSGTRGRGASDLRLHLKQSVLIWCFPSISVTTATQSGRSRCGGTESATARVADSLRRFQAQSESCGAHPGRRSKRLAAASEAESAAAVIFRQVRRFSVAAAGDGRGRQHPWADRLLRGNVMSRSLAPPGTGSSCSASQRLAAAAARRQSVPLGAIFSHTLAQPHACLLPESV
jgi:hypothetical protein